ncbi:MAG: hypothetical protein CVU35_02530 [Betaproteobacteria bacterium HGW-Betaproteobacteria-8]|nr:MAG: hypothetical protein CVU35_02530 [Betaproteobacteria bacterium HGW-Betaproteobacteria-8]
MDIIYSPFGEIDDEEYRSVVDAKIKEYESRLKTYEGGQIEFHVRETNHGRGADLLTVTVSLVSLAGTAFFAIPAAHKKIREAFEEWKQIGKEIDTLISRVSGNDRPSLPIEVLFFEAVNDLASSKVAESLEFLSACEIPTQEAYVFDDRKTYLFAFRDGMQIYLIAYDSYKTKLWSRQVPL